MIKLSKIVEPKYLADNADSWTADIVFKKSVGINPSKYDLNRYNHPEIKIVLIAETSGKCAYCESKILHVTFGDIEHIIPKSDDDNIRFKWHNLTLACDICNTRKSNIQGLIDPYTDDPESLFTFLGPVILEIDGDLKAYRTRVILDLNRKELREKRFERIEYIDSLISVIKKTDDDDLRLVLIKDLLDKELSSDKEFAATARSFVQARAPSLIDSDNLRGGD